jgi:putative transposase
LLSSDRLEERLAQGARLLDTIQLNERRGPHGEREFVIGLTTDDGALATQIRAQYQPRCEALALDFGLRALFGTDQGDLLGRRFLDRLRAFDARLTKLAAYRQKHGLRVRSPRYDREVRRLRGFLTSEIGRVLNRLVETHAPAHLVLERLRFQNPNLTRRLNRLLSNCGRAILQRKLRDLEERYGITSEEVNPAYSSQTCSNPKCEYVDRRNRRGERFSCLMCGKVLHADVNAPRTLRTRRSRPEEAAVTLHKSVVLRALVVTCDTRHRWRSERWIGPSGRPGEPRATNPYFTGKSRAVSSSRGDPPRATAQGASRR